MGSSQNDAKGLRRGGGGMLGDPSSVPPAMWLFQGFLFPRTERLPSTLGGRQAALGLVLSPCRGSDFHIRPRGFFSSFW